MKIQKYLANQNLGSRRQVEDWIRQWLIFVNGQKAHIWQIINPQVDKIKLDKKITDKNYKYYKFYKPKWIFTINALSWYKEIKDIVSLPEDIIPLWRLDKDSSWLIILTNDRTLQKKILEPQNHIEKEYLVRTKFPISDNDINKLENWIMIDGYVTKPAKVRKLDDDLLIIIISEWKNRQVRKMIRNINNQVVKLKRVRIWKLVLGKLKPWEYEEIKKSDIL